MDERPQVEVKPEPPKLPKGFKWNDDMKSVRDVRAKEHTELQLKLYAPCSCGSGKKFKFCCKGKKVFVINTGP